MGSQIQWTDEVWNPTTGCDKVSSGCKFCYAEVMANRLKRMGCARYDHGFALTLQEDKINEPLRWKKPRKVFVNSMSDLFHPDVDIDFLRRVFVVMQQTKRHTYQVLTKRPERMADVLSALQAQGHYTPQENIWLGTSVEDVPFLSRIDTLRAVPAHVRFLSCEPLLGDIGPLLDLDEIDWVIVGGESGQHLYKPQTCARRALVEYTNKSWSPKQERIDWVRHIRDVCLVQNTPFFFKQWGGARPTSAGRMLDGQLWNQYPDA